MGGFTVQIDGLAELEANLDKLKRPDKAMRKALRAAGEVFQRDIQMRTPVAIQPNAGSSALPAGAMKNDITITLTKDDDGNPAVVVGPGKYTAHVARFVEYGHYQVKGGRASYNKRKGKGTRSGKFVPAYPFIRPAYEASKEEAVDAFCVALADAIDKGEVK